MSARILDGKSLAARLRDNIGTQVSALKARNIVPGLTVVLVGDDAASHVYVRNKAAACEQAGMNSHVLRLKADTSQERLLSALHDLNHDPAVHGILVQLPLPDHIDDAAVIAAISPHKDVDGFHPYNVGRLMTGTPLFRPCTPYGIMTMLEAEHVSLWGAEAVVVGASNIVGKPMAMMMLAAGATVTLCNSKTRDLAAHTARADVLVAATGRPGLITGQMIKPGASVIDVGINRGADGRLTGDVEFDSARLVAGLITPVPGGVGPMTIAMLLMNTLQAAQTIANGAAHTQETT